MDTVSAQRLLNYVMIIAMIIVTIAVLSVVLEAIGLFEAVLFRIADSMGVSLNPPLTSREARALVMAPFLVLIVVVTFKLLQELRKDETA